MDLSCERCRTKKFRVTLGATCAYVICLRCGQELGTLAEDLAGRPSVVVVPVATPADLEAMAAQQREG
jgi:hypothetical protein